jgi:hypothetical protein
VLQVSLELPSQWLPFLQLFLLPSPFLRQVSLELPLVQILVVQRLSQALPLLQNSNERKERDVSDLYTYDEIWCGPMYFNIVDSKQYHAPK